MKRIKSNIMQTKSGFFSIPFLSLCHILLIALSNLLVQYPFVLFNFHTTWGAFTYPAIFILTDLSTRLFSAQYARKIIFCSMIPGLLISYGLASWIDAANHQQAVDLLTIHVLPLRIAFACLVAYVSGQLLDILVFQQYRNTSSWWLAPTLSSTLGNLVDTILFFAIAFYHCSNPFLSQHWVEIATIDMFFKIMISLVAFVPVYGIVLNMIGAKLNRTLANT